MKREVVTLDLWPNHPSFLAANLRVAADQHEGNGFRDTAADLRHLAAQVEGKATAARHALGSGAAAARPLVVIDPADGEAVERLLRIIENHHDIGTNMLSTSDSQAALREFANPKPPRVWTDGDVVTSPLRAYHRQQGRWWPTRPAVSTQDGYSDADMEEMLESSSCAVLREQAAEVTP